MGEYRRIEHTFLPVFDENSEILILGSLPSVKSRENGFYYGHPQNRFWKVIAEIFEWELPHTIEEKKEMLLRSRIAIWDVIQSCDIIGSSDSSIKNVEPADINLILGQSNIKAIYANGKTAGKLYGKFAKERTGRDIIELPSTSPANAAYNLERLIGEWKRIKNWN
ncbi:DNA-deoxyinosine glycosylase [Konateibacter massiliensis]|uniref:DNA-deoxyinosine glycosylase n=1 Tax=Konateibacter massiliensis TaxID=2002841 RepID=UPI000C15588F|nr:DNA-deoxyinosine glycosylase [Konateibacter massiliensis]